MRIPAAVAITILLCTPSSAMPAHQQKYDHNTPSALAGDVATLEAKSLAGMKAGQRSLQPMGEGSGEAGRSDTNAAEKKAAAKERRRKRIEARKRKRQKRMKAKRLREKRKKAAAESAEKERAEFEGKNDGSRPEEGRNAIPAGKCIPLGLEYVRLDEICCKRQDCQQLSDCPGTQLCIPYEMECNAYFYTRKCTPPGTKLSTYEIHNVLNNCGTDDECNVSIKGEKCMRHERPRDNQRACPAKGTDHSESWKNGKLGNIIPTGR